MTFDLPILIDDPDGGEHEAVATVTISGTREDVDVTATVDGKRIRPNEYWQNLALKEAALLS